MLYAYNLLFPKRVILRLMFAKSIHVIKDYATSYISKIDRAILLCSLLMLLIGWACQIANYFITQYPGNDYLLTTWKIMSPCIVIVLVFAWRFMDMVPRLAVFTRFYTLYFIAIFTMAIMLNGIQYTPFPIIDNSLVRWDQALGVNLPDILHWMAGHPNFRTILQYAYGILSAETFIIPILLVIFKLKRALNIYLLVFGITFIVGGLIYYFFPTASPVSVFQSTHFSEFEHVTYLKFYQIHHYIEPTTKDGGLIAFPSFHVIYAVIFIYVLREKLWLFFPMLIINLLAIVSTVFLGAHYAVDIIAGVLIAGVSILFARKYIDKHQADAS